MKAILLMALASASVFAQNPVSCGNNQYAAVTKNSVQFYRIGEDAPAVTKVTGTLTSLACDALGGFAVNNGDFLQLPIGGVEINYPVTFAQFAGTMKPVTLTGNAIVGSGDGKLLLAGTFAVGADSLTLFIDPRQGNLVVGQSGNMAIGNFCPTATTQVTVEKNAGIVSRTYLDEDPGQYGTMAFSIAPGGSYQMGCSENLSAVVFNNNGQVMVSTLTDKGTPFTATLGSTGAATSLAIADDGIYFTASKPVGRNSSLATKIYKVANGVATLYQYVPGQAVVLTISGQLTILVRTNQGWVVYDKNSANLQ